MTGTDPAPDPGTTGPVGWRRVAICNRVDPEGTRHGNSKPFRHGPALDGCADIDRMKIHTAVTRILLVGLLMVGLAACGDDDDEDTASGAPPASEESFCPALKAFNGAVFEIELDEESTEADVKAAHAKLEPLWAELKASAPDDQADAIADLDSSIEDLGEGDAQAFNADDTTSTYFGMVADVVGDCVEETTTITAVNYAFEGVPETLPAGESGIILENDSEDEPHEFVLFKKAAGETRSATEILSDPATEEQGPGEFAGVVFAGQGGRAGSFLDLQPGEYIAVCFIPVGGGEEGPPHFTRGMVSEVTVE